MIEIINLNKSYNGKQALQDLNLTIEKGELFGLLGPNGAGKTTTISILSSFIKADSGKVNINGLEQTKNINTLKSIIGLIPQELSIYEELSAWDNLLFWGKLYDIKNSLIKNRATELLKVTDLYNRRHEPVKNFSGGMKRRLNIIIGLIHDPDIIFFDEPTVGVDPQSRNFIFEMIKTLHKEQKTIIYTSHYIEEVEKLCTKIGIIDFGKLIAYGTIKELCDQLGYQEKIEIVLSNTNKTICLEGENIKTELYETLQKLDNSKQEISNISYTKANLEEVFLRLTGRKFRED